MQEIDRPLSVGQLAQVACVCEVAAPKAGNVHPGARFADATWMDFILSAAAIAPVLDEAALLGVGATVLRCVRTTRAVTTSNTNLGMVLLLAPLCVAARGSGGLATEVQRVLNALTPVDATAVYEAIRHAKPGGLGAVERGDVAQPPTIGLMEAMRLASERDAIARQYATGFATVFGDVAGTLAGLYREAGSLEWAVTLTHLRLMAGEPDSLIRRKCGDGIAEESRRRAAAVIDAIARDAEEAGRLFRELDAWLRADGNRRNPGASADLIAAGLFVCFREKHVELPFRW